MGPNPGKALALRAVLAPVLVMIMLLAASQAAAADDIPPEYIDPLRDLISNELKSAGFAAFMAGVLNVTISPDIAAANYDIEGEDGGDGTELSTFKIPFGHKFDLPKPGWALIVDGNLGYLHATNKAYLYWEDPDLNGNADVDWYAYTAQAGVGLKIPITKGLFIYPHVAVAYSYLKNEADYSNSQLKEFFSPILDGLIFDWHMQAMTYSAALGAGYGCSLDPVDFNLRAIFTHAYTDSFEATDELQNVSTNTDTLVADLECRGPLGLSIAGHDLNWLALGGYTTFFGPDRDILGFSYLVQLGGGVEMNVESITSWVSHLGIKGSWLVGDNVTGWQVGLAIRF